MGVNFCNSNSVRTVSTWLTLNPASKTVMPPQPLAHVDSSWWLQVGAAQGHYREGLCDAIQSGYRSTLNACLLSDSGNSITNGRRLQNDGYSHGLDGRSLIPGRGKTYFSTQPASWPVLDPTPPPLHWVPGDFFSGIKRPGCEADNSPPSNVEVKNGGVITPLPDTSSWRST
jgi:hypothetical protein